MKNLFYCIIILTACSFSDPSTVKRISDKDFRYEFYTTQKTVKPKGKKTYYWFKGGLIHSAEAGVFGELLHGNYTKMFHSNQLAEQGVFKNGLKIGLWKTWHENGKVETAQYWDRGMKNGTFLRFNKDGQLVEKGSFRKDLKVGVWINHEAKEKTRYRKGVIKHQKTKLTKDQRKELKEEKAKEREFKKKKKAEEREFEKKQKAEIAKAKKEKKASEKNESEKSGFFKRLFSKKEKKVKNDGSGT